jgi:hypothetical protein
VKSLVRIVDDALPPNSFRLLKQRILSLGSERLRNTYQTTFWFDFKHEPTNIVERVVQSNLRTLIGTRDLRGVKGAEWWLSRMRTSNVKVDFHVDRDNALFDSTGRLAHPTVSSLLYLNECRGGLLAVTSEPASQNNVACAPDIHAFDFVEPRANRFAFFDGTLTHGVLDSHNEIPGKRRAREPRLRYAIAINFWKRQPKGVRPYAKSLFYAALQLK